MTLVSTSPFSVAAARRATRRRWLIRVVAGIVLSFALAYATLPLWLPTERLRQQLETQLSDDLGVPVRIANVRAGWLEGVVLEDLTIANPSSGKADGSDGRGQLARVGQIRCDLSPFTVVAGATLRELEITDPQIWLEIDDTGQIKLPAFKSKQGGKLPSFNYSVRGLMCHVVSPRIAQNFRIDRLNVQLDPLTGYLHLTSVTRVTRPNPDADEPAVGRLDFDANFRIPRLKKSERLNGSLEVEWSDLALTDLPVPLISHVPVEQVDGTTSGRVTVQTRPDLSIDYTVAMIFNRVRIMRPDLNRPAQVPDAELSCAGRWDPTEGHVLLKDLVYETPAVRLESRGGDTPALRIDEDSETPLEAHVRGVIKNWRELRNELPEVDHALQSIGVGADGQAGFAVDVTRGARVDRLGLTVDGRDSQWTVAKGEGSLLDAERGLPKDLKLEILHERATGRIQQPVFLFTMGDTQIEANGELTLPPDETESAEDLRDPLAESISSFRGHVAIRCGDVTNLRKVLPVLAARPEIDEWTGAFEAAVDVEPQDGWTHVRFAADLPADAVIRSGDLVQKRSDQELALRVETKIPYASSGRVDLLNTNLRYGAGELDLSSHTGSLDYRLDFHETVDGPVLAGADGTWRADMRVRSAENLVSLSPSAARAMKEAGVTFLSGQFDVTARTDFSYRPGDSIVRTLARVLADDLAIRWKDRITKRAGEPVSIEVAHRIRSCEDGIDQCLSAAMVQPAGTIRGSVLTSQDLAHEPSQSLQILDASAKFDEVADGINLFTAAAEQMKLQASGGVSAYAHVVKSGDLLTGRVQVTADECDLSDTRGLGFHKPTGLPLSAHVAWQAGPNEQDPRLQEWTITDGRANLGGTGIEKLGGTFVITEGTNALSKASIRASGKLDLSSSLAGIQPRIEQLIRQFAAGGQAEWDLNVNVDETNVSATAKLDAAALWFSTPPPSDPRYQFTKVADHPLSVAFDVSAPRPAAGLPESVTINSASVQLAENSLSGKATLARSTDGQNRLVPTVVNVQADLSRLEELLEYLPEAPLETLAGGMKAQASFVHKDGQLALDDGQVSFDHVAVGPVARPLNLNGSCTFDDRAIHLEQLDWGWGESRGTLSGTLVSSQNHYDVQLGFGGRELKIEDLLSCVREMQASLEPPKTEPATASNTATPANPMADIIDLLRRTRVRMDGHVDTLHTPLPLGIKAIIDAGWQEMKLEKGALAMQFGCLVDGGAVDGQVTADLNAADPKYRLTYNANRIQPGPLVDAYLRRTFPGMIATGPLTLIDETVQKLMPAPGEPNAEIGKGELIIDGGTVSGRAAPMWMARIFPGLNISSFEFTRMHSWFDKTADYRVHHQMIYQGAYYNVYMIGWSNPQGYFDYEVGIDFLAGLESEYWANTGQGRVPLFNKTGRVLADGSLQDETVTFVSLTRTLESLFVRNNPVVTAYHAVRKRVLGKT